MGIYNCATTLVEALDSLYAQTYQNFKIILCDDGSTDNTYQIAAEYAKKHDNIILIKNDQNKGLNYTLNHCLEYADTEYVARMDGDDISLPTRFEKEIAFLDSHPEYAIVSCPMIYFDENGDYKVGQTKSTDPIKRDFILSTPFCHAPCMVRSIAYKAVNGYSVDKRLIRVEDYHLWFKMYAAGYKGHNLSEPLYKMRDDRNATRRRTLSNRLNEVYVKHIGYKMLQLPIYSQIYAIRPLLVWLLPNPIYNYLHRN
jgi:glycosyltransferase EpsE